MKYGLLVSLATAAVMATSTLAAEFSSKQVAGQFAIALTAAKCAADTLPSLQPTESGPAHLEYAATNNELHRCQYFREISALECTATETCPSYEEWSAANPLISPFEPRSKFLAALIEHQTALSPLAE